MSTKVLDIQDVTVSFDGFKAINHLNFSMDEVIDGLKAVEADGDVLNVENFGAQGSGLLRFLGS
ncbi:MAG: hypothetical protein AAFW95_13820 [Cyanobacteria bacterium J06638_6]